MKLEEALAIKDIKYSGSREDYKINDPSPSILVIDEDYNVDGKGSSVLAFNLNYLDSMKKADKMKLITKVNKIDNKLLKIGPIKAWLRSIFNQGDYELSKDEKIRRYKEIVKAVPELKKIIRRYKHSAIEKEKR